MVCPAGQRRPVIVAVPSAHQRTGGSAIGTARLGTEIMEDLELAGAVDHERGTAAHAAASGGRTDQVALTVEQHRYRSRAVRAFGHAAEPINHGVAAAVRIFEDE